MSDDDFEESAGSSSETTEEYKYAQLHVPGFEFDVSSATAAREADKHSGSSFVRLGSFPAFSLQTTDGKRAVASVADDAPSGFANSLNLAKFVGDASEIAAAEASGDSAAGDSGIQRSSHFKGDSTYLLGFTDDTRSRVDDAEGGTDEKIVVDGVSTTNTQAARQAETQRLLTKGGWWDHSDGNRITTTTGDKIEVIQGNYKMVVMGRQDPTQAASGVAGNSFITDISGGHLQEQGPSPTPCIKSVEWVKSEDGWTLFQDNGSGNVTTKFHGKQVDYYTGTRKETYVGNDPGGYDGNLTHLPDDDCDPVLVSKTWAKRIENYAGSDGKPVQVIYSHTHAESINNLTFATEIANFVMAASVFNCNISALTVSMNTGVVAELNLTSKSTLTLKEDKVTLLRNVISAEKLEAIGAKLNLVAAVKELIASRSAVVAQETQVQASHVAVVGRRNAVVGGECQITTEDITVAQTGICMLGGQVLIA